MDPERAADNLARERARVENSLAALAEDTGTGPGSLAAAAADPGEPADRADALVQRELDNALEGRLRFELEAIGAAEERLRAGTYGKSVESGEEIPDERLEAIPWAERTLEEQERLEAN